MRGQWFEGGGGPHECALRVALDFSLLSWSLVSLGPCLAGRAPSRFDAVFCLSTVPFCATNSLGIIRLVGLVVRVVTVVLDGMTVEFSS